MVLDSSYNIIEVMEDLVSVCRRIFTDKRLSERHKAKSMEVGKNLKKEILYQKEEIEKFKERFI